MPGLFTGRLLFPGRRWINWKFLRAIVFPFVVVSVPVGILLVLEFRSLDRFEAASAEILRRSAVQATEELSDRIVEEFWHHYGDHDAADVGRVAAPAAPVDDRETPVGTRPAGALDDADSVPDLSTDEGARPPSLMGLPTGGGDTDSRPAVSGMTPRTTLRGWHPPVGLARNSGTGLPADRYFGLADQLRPVRTAGPLEDGSRILAVDARELAEDYLPVIVSGMRAQRRGLLTGPPLELSVLDDRGLEIYRTGPSVGEDYVHQVEFPFLASHRQDLSAGSDRGPLWSVRAGYPGTTVADLAHARTNHQRQLLFFVAFVATAGIVLTSRAMARELKVQKMRSDFISGVSHDLKTPLASIQIFAETLASSRATSDKKVREYARMIGIEASKLGRLIHDMLDSNKIEAGTRRYPMEEVDLEGIVREALAGFEPQLADAGFTTRLSLADDSLRFLGNREGLRQALDNLISNAIKFRDETSEDAEHHLTVRLQRDDDNAVIEVEDRGIGIPAAERRRVFERFYRVVQEPDTDAAGTGLGLAIVEHVVDSHGGRVTVQGNRHGGSTFRVELPLWFSGGAPE